MRWPKTPTDILSEKTFLVIRDNLQTIQEKSQEREADIIESPKKTNSSCDTWPPKMRKKRPRKSNSNNNGNSENSDIEEPRPATASLEAPLVLDPRLVDKLDMSLLSKESLTASLTRINLGLVKSLDNNTTTKSLDSTATKSLDITASKASIESSIKSNNHQKPAPTTRTRIPSPPTRVSARREQLAHSLESSSVLLETDITRTSNEVTSNPEVKRLDDNNNKNKNGSTCQHHLSPLRSRSSRGINLADVSLISGASAASARKKILPNNTNVTPEACKSCGRSCLPERLHSHPKSPTYLSKELVNSARSSPSVIPIRTTGNRSLRKSAKIESTQSPDTNLPSNMASPKSEKSVGSFAKSPSSECAPAKKDRKLTSTAIPKSKDDKPVTAVQEKKRRPRSVTCYICGREFGTASFPIHEPKCLEKWQRENDALPAAQRRKLPIRPEVPFDHEDWNTAAWEQSQALLVPCIKCKRTFLPDRLPVHERNCRVPNKESQKK